MGKPAARRGSKPARTCQGKKQGFGRAEFFALPTPARRPFAVSPTRRYASHQSLLTSHFSLLVLPCRACYERFCF